MKKILILASLALLACACTREDGLSPLKNHFTMTVNADYDESKTAIGYDSESESYVPTWTNGDAIQVLEFSNDTKVQEVTSEGLDADSEEASFQVKLGTIEGSNFKYYAVYPAASYSKQNDFYRLNLPDEQTFSATTFGPGSDLLISSSVEESVTTRPSSVNLKFKRIGAIVGITVKGMNSGEKIESVTISTTDQYIAGYSKYNPTAAEWLGTYTASERSITTTPIGTFTTTGVDLIWFRTYGVTLGKDLAISVTTDKAIYSKTIDLENLGKTIEFKEGGMTKFAVNSLKRTARSVTKYANATGINVGDRVIIVSTNKGSYYAAGELMTGVSKPYLQSVSASLGSDNLITTDGLIFTLGKDGDYWTFSNNDQLLGTTAANKMAFGSGTTTWSVSFDQGIASVKSSNTSFGALQFNSSSPRFTTYTSSQTAIYIYSEVPESVVVSGTPAKTVYVAGEEFDPTGLTVTVKYADESEHTITDGVEWTYDPETLQSGDTECSVAAKFNGVSSAAYKVSGLTVSEGAELVSIAVSGTPGEFWKGDTFNHNGITVTATYEDESTKDVTEDCSFSTPDMSTAGNQTVTVTYKEMETTYDIEVKTIANTLETAYTVTEAKAIIDKNKDLSTSVYVKGVVSKVESYNEYYGSITYWLDSDAFEVYGGLNLGGEKFTSINDIAVNSDVIVYGLIKKFNSTYEFSSENQLAYYLPAPTLSIADLTVKKGDAINPVITTNVEAPYTMSYTSNDSNVVAVSGSTLTTVGTGTATITASLSKEGWKSVSTTFDVTVTSSAELQSITIDGSLTKTTYVTGEAFDRSGLIATGHYSDETSQDLTSIVTWSSDPETLTTTGTIDVTVTAKTGTVEGTKVCQVTVNEPKTAVITISSFNNGTKWSSYTTVSGNVKGSDEVSYELSGEYLCYNASYIQWRRSKSSKIYNKTSFGRIISIDIEDSTGATFNASVGTSSGSCTKSVGSGMKTFNVTGSYGFFELSNYNTTIANTTKITIKYQ